ncbi:MAG: ferrous iron transport protein B [Bacilli bacterium]
MNVGLVGNPNVGKSTIFNTLTGLRQHTGNWPGKTVEKATGYKKHNGVEYQIDDLPGTYSLMAHSKEEEVTRDFIYFNNYDALIIVCDAVCLERNLNLVLQVLEVTDKVVVCVNLIDEAKKKGITIDFEKLSSILKVPVIPTTARSGKGINELLNALEQTCKTRRQTYKVEYNDIIKEAIQIVKPIIHEEVTINKDAIALKLINNDPGFAENYEVESDKILKNKISEAKDYLYKKGIKGHDLETMITEDIISDCEKISNEVVSFSKKDYQKRDRVIDRILTGKLTGYPIMLLMLLVIFWITITGANYPSELLYDFFFGLETHIINFLEFLHIPDIVINCLVFGIYRVLAWVVSVMLPPMAIFFPLFTLLEDLGYLPRIAFNLDKAFKKCASCGKQALTMAMGFGCNAVGVIGARIINSPRERLIAILTNSFVPCNGRFPILISMITMFFIISMGNSSLASAAILTLMILIGIIMTFIISKILSKTILKGMPSSFTLELPPYRRPQIGKVVIRSILDRTLFVLKRAVCISAPAGLVIWLMANINIGDASILQICSGALDPFARAIGLDGVILMAFILGFPANEIVIPIMIMGYMSLGYITDFDNLSSLKTLFIDNGWTTLTAICVMLFALMHWPCLTTVFTIKKETGSNKWALLSILIPALTGIIVCFLVTQIYHLIF